MRVAGLVFVGTRTDNRAEMAGFVRDALGLADGDVPGVDADMFDLPDGSTFAVAPADGSCAERTIGFLVEDLDSAAAELRVAGVEVDREATANERFRYIHFRAPDGHMYELVERRGD